MRRRGVRWLALAGLLALAPAVPARAAITIPKGFVPLKSYLGAALYARTTAARTEYVQVVALELGGAVKLLAGPITEPGTGLGGYGGANPAFLRRSLGEFWASLQPLRADTFAVTNGAFFRATEAPSTHLAYPLKVGGVLLTDGYNTSRHLARKLMLTLRNRVADIVPLTPEGLAAAGAPALLGGLAPGVDPYPGQRVGRTLVGVRDTDSDGSNEVVLIYASAAATQEEAVAALTEFGATRTMVLAGGASTQMIARGTPYIAAGSPIPQAVGVRGAARPPQGTYRASHTVKRAGNCTIGGGDVYTREEEVELVREADGFSFVPSLDSTIRATYAHADRAGVVVNLMVICASGQEHHSVKARAVFEEGAIRIPTYRITWCESQACIFDESWTIRTAPSLPQAAPPAQLRIEEAPASGRCAGADCSPSAADL